MASPRPPFGPTKCKPHAHFTASETESQEGGVSCQKTMDLTMYLAVPAPFIQLSTRPGPRLRGASAGEAAGAPGTVGLPRAPSLWARGCERREGPGLRARGWEPCEDMADPHPRGARAYLRAPLRAPSGLPDAGPTPVTQLARERTGSGQPHAPLALGLGHLCVPHGGR